MADPTLRDAVLGTAPRGLILHPGQVHLGPIATSQMQEYVSHRGRRAR
jgi:hypothetical protein